MGLNKYGVAACSNAGPTKNLDPPDGIQLSRGEVLKEGLEYSSAKDAVKHTLGKLTDSRMKIPGILFFVDSNNIYVIEAHKNFAVIHITDGYVVRANRFLVLENNDINNEKTISSICRYSRGKQLLEESFGKIDRQRFIAFSMDHKNGPGTNSICRHSRDPKEAITVSASVMELDSEYPERSKISVALGSPCWAWRNSNGNFTFQMNDDIGRIPKNFFDGSAFLEYFKEEPFEKECT